MKIFANNKKALFEYEVVDSYEAGVVLHGWEVKSIRDSRVNMKDGFVKITGDEAFVYNVHISRWKTQSGNEDINETGPRKLLLKKSEIIKLDAKSKEKGFTIVPLKFYQLGTKIKLEIALVRGKKQYDKRAKLKEKDQKRQIEEDLKYRGF